MENIALQRKSPHQSTQDQQSFPSSGKSLAPPPFQLQAKGGSAPTDNPGSPIQRYPIEKDSSKKLVSASGRPNAKSNKSTIQGIVARIWKIGAQNSLEKKLRTMGNKSDAVDAIDGGKFLSTNGAAICHKEAISTIEKKLVNYCNMVLNNTNDSSIDTAAQEWIKSLTTLDSGKQSYCLSLLKAIRTGPANSGIFADPASDMANFATALVKELDGSFSNLYIGHARTNSSVSDNFDPHYNIYSATDPSATPISMSIYESQKSFGDSMGYGHASPQREFDGTDYWNKSSSVPNKGYVAYNSQQNQYL